MDRIHTSPDRTQSPSPDGSSLQERYDAGARGHESPLQHFVQNLQNEQPTIGSMRMSDKYADPNVSKVIGEVTIVDDANPGSTEHVIPPGRNAIEMAAEAVEAKNKLNQYAAIFKQAFEQYHQGVDGLNPLQVIFPAELTLDGLAEATKNAGTPEEKEALTYFSKEFSNMAGKEGNPNTVSENEIDLWLAAKITGVDNRRDPYYTGRRERPWTDLQRHNRPQHDH